MDLLLQLLANGLVNGALFALLAVAFGLVYRSLRVFHVAFAGLFLIPPYAAYLANVWLSAPIWLAVILGVAAGAVSGYLIELVLYRPFFRRNVSGGAVIVASLGAFIIIENLLAMGFGSELKTMGRELAKRFVLGPVSLTNIQIIQFLVATAALAVVSVILKKIRMFKIIWAMGDEPGLAPVLGLPLMGYRALVFSFSAGLAGLAGGLIVVDVGVDPHMGLSYLLVAAVAVLAGGIDRFRGWVLGGVSLALLQSLMVWQFSAQWMDLVTFSVLIGILLFRPQGMLGLRKRLEEE
uniref:Amino acid/amide ABC transporter membrane protein 1, HAAT family n=1 Tax=Candidatus Kentrum sp. MB TaxID=2138164 RepID=A0A450X5Y6_9GAMM|nr:MAG: amino acid/amide ABC transporter membrane protein 1, HAAT family [Candidatus Kentron sp. MB]VFK27032.1 MAG: amino acid/amide ABC transporter membrane protein 1, HAAT family [Candidatus Kentron sp. MB]VFK74931.1 MAG: amino acid/amide ABC transporter membrane protein 1, HAAT family [Candidatus Kentron sp. MB]